MSEATITADSGYERIWKDISELGLERYAADLDEYGYTVIPPEIAMPSGLAEQMLEAEMTTLKPEDEPVSISAG